MASTISNELRHFPVLKSFTPPQGEADPMPSGDENGVMGSKKNTIEFKDVIDVLNPLQHLPIVSNFYRAVSGDEIGTVPKFLGSALYGGPAGLVIALGSYIANSEMGSEAHHATKRASSGSSRRNSVSPTNARADSPINSAVAVDGEYQTPAILPFIGSYKPNKVFQTNEIKKNKTFNLTASVKHPTTVQPAPHDLSAKANKNTVGQLTGFSTKSGKLTKNLTSYLTKDRIGTPSVNINLEEWMLHALGKYEKIRLR